MSVCGGCAPGWPCHAREATDYLRRELWLVPLVRADEELPIASSPWFASAVTPGLPRNKGSGGMPDAQSPRPTPRHQSERITPRLLGVAGSRWRRRARLRGASGRGPPKATRRTIEGGAGGHASAAVARPAAGAASPTDPRPAPHRGVARGSNATRPWGERRAQAGHTPFPNAPSPPPAGIHPGATSARYPSPIETAS